MHDIDSEGQNTQSDNRVGTDRRQMHSNELFAYRNRRDGMTGDRREPGTEGMPDRGWRTRLARRVYQLFFGKDLQTS